MHSCTKTHTHTHTGKQTNAKKHIITQLSMVMGLHRSFWKCSETLQICVTQHGKSATSCLSPHPPLSLFFFKSLCHAQLIFSYTVSLLIVCLFSARTPSKKTTPLFTVFVSRYVYLSAGAPNVTGSADSSDNCFRCSQWRGKSSRKTQ